MILELCDIMFCMFTSFSSGPRLSTKFLYARYFSRMKFLIESITQGACRSRTVVISFRTNFDTDVLEIFLPIIQ